MIESLQRQLTAFLRRSFPQVYAQGAVPPDTPFPFVTFQAEPPLSRQGVGMLTLTSWHQGEHAHADCVMAADMLFRLVPPIGLRLCIDGGLAILYRDNGALEWLEESGARGVRLRFRLRVLGPCP